MFERRPRLSNARLSRRNSREYLNSRQIRFIVTIRPCAVTVMGQLLLPFWVLRRRSGPRDYRLFFEWLIAAG